MRRKRRGNPDPGDTAPPVPDYGEHIETQHFEEKETMKRGYRNYIVDIGLLINTLLCFATGVVKWPGLTSALGLSYQDLPMTAITSIHDVSGMLIGVFACIHIILHWRWILTMTGNIVKQRSG